LASSASAAGTTSFTPPTALLSQGWTPMKPWSRRRRRSRSVRAARAPSPLAWGAQTWPRRAGRARACRDANGGCPRTPPLLWPRPMPVNPPRVRFAPSRPDTCTSAGAHRAVQLAVGAAAEGHVHPPHRGHRPRAQHAGVGAGHLDGMRWMGLDWDEGPRLGGPHGPYFQDAAPGDVREHAEELIAKGAPTGATAPRNSSTSCASRRRGRSAGSSTRAPAGTRSCPRAHPERWSASACPTRAPPPSTTW